MHPVNIECADERAAAVRTQAIADDLARHRVKTWRREQAARRMLKPRFLGLGVVAVLSTMTAGSAGEPAALLVAYGALAALVMAATHVPRY